jgi:hypothetical protein
MNIYTIFKYLILGLFFTVTFLTAQNWDNFEDGTTQGWTNGGNTDDPTNQASGGPGGVDDNYLEVVADGAGSGGRLTVFNTDARWAQNYTAGGLSEISFHVNNVSGSSNIDLRISLMLAGGTVNDDNFWCSTTNSVPISTTPGWNAVFFSITVSDLTALGTSSVTDILADVGQIRIIDASAGPSRQGDFINTTLGIDNITTGDSPLPVELSSFRAIGGDSKVTINWVTQSETNNQGFIVNRAESKNGTYNTIASYEYLNSLLGAGNSSTRKSYSYIDNDVTNETTYWYKLVDVSSEGNISSHGPVSATPQASEVENSPLNFPKEFALHQNFPNPFNPSTEIFFDIPGSIENGSLKIEVNIYNLLGEKISTLYKGIIEPGNHQLSWNGLSDFGNKAPSGIYIYQIKSSKFTASKRMILLK